MLQPDTLTAKATLTFNAIGTAWSISGNRIDAATEAAIRVLIDAFDRRYSRFRDDSFVSHIARASGRYSAPEDIGPMLAFYKRLYDATDGRITPLIGHLMEDAGYDKRYSLQPKPLRAVPSWDESLAYDHPTLELHQPVLLDFGAAGKGYLVDQVAALLRARGAGEFVINAGGDLYASAPTRVALERPDDVSEAVGVATIDCQALCGSAGNRRAWNGFTHIIDPFSLRSPSDVQAAWVIAGSALVADGLATALFFTPPARLLRDFRFEYAIIAKDGSLYASDGFTAEFFTK